MEKKNKYCIGEVEKICSITKKTLRYYDKIGLLSPFEISENGYRYYNKENLYTVPVIKYYKQSGFTLESIKKVMNEYDYEFIENSFSHKIKDLEEQERELLMKKRSIEDWHSLVKEAKMVIDYKLTDVSIKYMEPDRLIFHNQVFSGDYISSVINIEFTNYLEEIGNAITGPVIIEFSSLEDKIKGKEQNIRMLQKNLIKCDGELLTDYGASLAISCYHIGSHEKINETYEKMCQWAKIHNYKYEDKCYERYVMDYWTTKDTSKFVTEIFIKIKE